MTGVADAPAHLVAFDSTADADAVEAVLGRVVAAGGDVVLVAGGGAVVRVADAVAEAVADHPAVTHVGAVTLPDRTPTRIRRPAAHARSNRE
ncbi:MAG: hypothetical protein ABEJ82_02870 [Haloplanus sp.]